MKEHLPAGRTHPDFSLPHPYFSLEAAAAPVHDTPKGHDPRCANRHHDHDECFDAQLDPVAPDSELAAPQLQTQHEPPQTDPRPDLGDPPASSSPSDLNHAQGRPRIIAAAPSCHQPGRWPCVSSLAFLDAPETQLGRAIDAARAEMDGSRSRSVVFRHSGWARERRLVLDSLVRTSQTSARVSDFLDCGRHAYVLQSITDPDRYRIAGSSCHDRFCLPCARERSNAIALNVLDRVQGKRLRFLTLTVQNTNLSLENRLNHLYKSFRTLRTRALWLKKVSGGVAFLEVKWSTRGQHWHPHFHILLEGSYLPWRQLKALWYAITKDSHVIDIRPVRDLQTAARYVTKYASKPFNNSFVNRPERLDEAVLALKGRKLLTTFGSWRGITLARPPDDSAWINIGPLEDFLKYGANDSNGDGKSVGSLAELVQKAGEARGPPMNTSPVRPEPKLCQTKLFPEDNECTSHRRPSQPT